MAADFPEKVAELHNPNPNGTLAGENHADIEKRQNEEIIAIQNNLGTGGIEGVKKNLKERLATSLDEEGKIKILVYDKELNCFIITPQKEI